MDKIEKITTNNIVEARKQFTALGNQWAKIIYNQGKVIDQYGDGYHDKLIIEQAIKDNEITKKSPNAPKKVQGGGLKYSKSTVGLKSNAANIPNGRNTQD